MPRPTSQFLGSGVWSEEDLGGWCFLASAELVALSIPPGTPSEETGETKHGESTLEGTELSIGDTTTGLLWTDERGSLLVDLSFVLEVLIGVELSRRAIDRSWGRRSRSWFGGVLGVLGSDLFRWLVLALAG